MKSCGNVLEKTLSESKISKIFFADGLQVKTKENCTEIGKLVKERQKIA